jgi:hypothetical protein
MNIKKEVAERIKTMLQAELNKCNNKIHDNLFQFKKLSDEQTILKRERAKLAEMLKSFTGGSS